MTTEKNNLTVFAFGLALLIPFIVMLHMLRPLNVWMFMFGVVAVLTIISHVATHRWIYNAALIGVYAFIAAKGSSQHMSLLTMGFLVLAFGIWVVSTVKIELITPVFTRWTKAAHFIGTVITGLILSILFYVVFGIAGIILRILRKDLLDETLEPDKGSYWVKRGETSYDGNNYLKQY